MKNDGVQDMLPQNMAHWHSEYFKLKELQKKPFPCPSPPKLVIKPRKDFLAFM
jgi:hypothetical protein